MMQHNVRCLIQGCADHLVTATTDAAVIVSLLPWRPKTWKDVLSAARKIKVSNHDAWPLWLGTGTAQGASGAAYGTNNLLLGSSDPTIYDAKQDKWVVDSKGLREVIDI